MPRSSRHKSKKSVKEGRECYLDTEGDTSSRDVDLRSKVSGSRHDSEIIEENVDLFVGKEESVSGKGECKGKLDRDFNRKDDYKLKDAREKEKGSERDRRSEDSKRDWNVDRKEQKVKKEFESKDWCLEDEYGKHDPEKEGDRRRKKRTGKYDDKDKYQDRERDSSDVNVTSRRDRVKDGTERDERHKDITHRDKHHWPLNEVYGKHESEKERETRRRKRSGESDDKDKYQEGNKDSSDINVTSRRGRNKDGRDRDERHKDSSSRDKNHDYYDQNSKSGDVDKREGTDKERTQKYDEYSDDRASRDHVGSKNESNYARDEFDSLHSQKKKSRNDANNFDGSVIYDDQCSRYKNYKETRGSFAKQEYGDMKSQGAKEYLDSANKSSGVREEIVTDESTPGQSRQKRAPSSTGLAIRDQYRHSMQSDTKYRESLPDERLHNNLNFGKEGNGSGVYDRTHSSIVIDKSVQRVDGGHIGDLSSERHRTTERRVSPAWLADKSLLPSSTELRHISRNGDRRSLDYEDSGHRSSSYKDANHHFHDGKRSQDMKVEAMHDYSQADGESMHGSSSFTRSARNTGNSRSFLSPASPLKHVVDITYAGSAEEVGRSKSNNHPKRSVDSSMGRMQGNAWWGAPNWSSPMENGYLPYPHGPAAAGFHPMMQHFPPQMFGVRPPMDHSGVPFRIPDGDRFPGYGRPFGWPNPVDETWPSTMLNWDSNNMVPGEGFTQGRADWDQNRSLTSSASRESGVDRYKGANSATIEPPSGNRRATAEPNDDLSSPSTPGLKNEPFQYEHQVGKAGNENKFGSKLSLDMSAPLNEISGRISKSKLSEEGMVKVDTDVHVHRSCAYLSKIDISAHLASSDLFDQCVSLLAVKQSIPSDARTSRVGLKEENDVGGECTKINTYFSSVSVFAEVSELLHEKAMSLYRQHRDDTAVNYSSSTSVRVHVQQSPENQGSESFSVAPSQLGISDDQELAYTGPPNEFQASSNNVDREAMPIIHPKLEAPSPMICDNLDVDISNQPEVPLSMVSYSKEAKEDLPFSDTRVSTAGDVAEKKKPLEETDIDDEAVSTCIAEARHEAARCVEEDADDGMEETNDEQAAIETCTTGLPSTTNVHFEGCEDTMMTELNECGSVNLSRIH